MKASCGDREEILEYPRSELPADAQFKGYVREASRREEVIVQEHKLLTDNVLGRKQKYYSPSLGKNLPGSDATLVTRENLVQE